MKVIGLGVVSQFASFQNTRQLLEQEFLFFGFSILMRACFLSFFSYEPSPRAPKLSSDPLPFLFFPSSIILCEAGFVIASCASFRRISGWARLLPAAIAWLVLIHPAQFGRAFVGTRP